MPLRARLNDDAPGSGMVGAYISPIEDMSEFNPAPEDEKDDVLFSVRDKIGLVQLNRPKKLHSLNISMLRKLISVLAKWENDPAVDVVLVTATGNKAFCAGGDVALLAIQNTRGKEGQRGSEEYFAIEYKLNHLIATYKKPYVAIIDGITMGGGMGISCHGPFRVATEKTMFAMPETDIGLFPDVGGGFFLSRLDGGLGAYFAMTASRVKGIQTLYSGIATHYVSASIIPKLIESLYESCANMSPDSSYEERLRIVNAALNQFSHKTPREVPIQLTGETRKAIDEVFCLPTTVPQVLEQLSAIEATFSRPEEVRTWAAKTRSIMMKGKSPTSMEVTLRQLDLARQWTIAETFEKEYLMASRFMQHPDFVNGVKSKLINKPASKPTWDPPEAGTVPASVVEKFFVPRAGLLRLKMLRKEPGTSYTQYPHAWTALPSEARIRSKLEGQLGPNIPRIAEQLADGTGDVVSIERKVREVQTRMSTA